MITTHKNMETLMKKCFKRHQKIDLEFQNYKNTKSFDFWGFKSMTTKTNEFSNKLNKEQRFTTHNHHVYKS